MSEASPTGRNPDAEPAPTNLVLTDEHRMLIEIRDTLYEGSWEDFKRDLEARRRGQPHVFETVPESPEMLATIGTHLELIDAMWAWERANGQTLRGDGSTG